MEFIDQLEHPHLDVAEREHQDLTPDQLLRRLGGFKPQENRNELTAGLDRRYDEHQEVQKEHDRRQGNS